MRCGTHTRLHAEPWVVVEGSQPGGRGEPAWVVRYSFLQGPRRDLGTKCPEMEGQTEKKLG